MVTPLELNWANALSMIASILPGSACASITAFRDGVGMPVGVGIIGIIHTVMVTTEEIYHTIMDQEATTVTTTTEAVLEITTI